MTAVGFMLTLAAYLALIGVDWRNPDTPTVTRAIGFIIATQALIAGVALTAIGEAT